MAKLTSGTRIYGNVIIDTFISAAGNITAAGANADIGTTTANATFNIGAGVTTAGNTKNINIGTAGAASSNTIIIIGTALGTGNVTFPANTRVVMSNTSSTALTVSGGIRSSNATAGVGYSTGAGLTVTQLTNRATGVTINAVTGTITLFSVAGNTTPTTFTMTNSTVAATDVIIMNQKSGTNIYHLTISNVVAGSAGITVWTTGGVTAEAPIINFAVIKGVTA